MTNEWKKDREACDGATPGPWEAASSVTERIRRDLPGSRGEQAVKDQIFISRARLRWPESLDEIERLQAEVDLLSEDLGKIRDRIGAHCCSDGEVYIGVESMAEELENYRTIERSTPDACAVLEGLLEESEEKRVALEAEVSQLKANRFMPGAPHGIDDCPTYYDGCNCTMETLEHNIKRAEKAEAEVARLRSRITVGDIVTYQGSKYEVEAIKRFPKDIGIRVRLVIGQDAPRELMLYDGWASIEDVTLAEKGEPNGLG